MMVENAGIGIIMKSGALTNQIKNGNVVSSNNESGVAEGINKYFLKK